MHRNQRVAALVQCTASDLYHSKNQENYCIGVVKRSEIFDKVVLAVPDTLENRVFDKLSKRWKVEVVKGPQYDVCNRILKAANIYKIDIIVRLLLKRFYLDTKLISSMLELLVDKGADYVSLPLDFNYELAGDLFTTKALQKASKILTSNLPNNEGYKFSPWQFMEDNQKTFKVVQHPGTDNYPKSVVIKIKNKLSELLGENQIQFGWDFPASSYAFVSKFINKEQRILDIACGQGEGTRQLSQYCKEIVGVDIDAKYIQNAKRKFGSIVNLSFEQGDATKYYRPNAFNAITSMHTLEHLTDPLSFLKLCHRNLKPGGILFVEVPILIPRPLGEPLYPFHKTEFKINQLEQLLKKSRFKILRRIGKSRHIYTKIEQARVAVHYHCSPDI